MKAQISLEYLLVIGVILLVLLPIFAYSVSSSVQAIKMNQANDVVKTITETADTLYALGPGSQDTIKIIMPGGVKNATIANKEVIVQIQIFGGTTDVNYPTKANISGTLNLSSGVYYITIKNENNTIKVTG